MRRRLNRVDGLQLRMHMAAAGLSQLEVARAVGVSASHLHNQLAGRFSMSEEQETRLRRFIASAVEAKEEADEREAVAV